MRFLLYFLIIIYLFLKIRTHIFNCAYTYIIFIFFRRVGTHRICTFSYRVETNVPMYFLYLLLSHRNLHTSPIEGLEFLPQRVQVGGVKGI